MYQVSVNGMYQEQSRPTTVIYMEFQTLVSGKTLTTPVECTADKIDSIMRCYKRYGWDLIHFHYQTVSAV